MYIRDRSNLWIKVAASLPPIFDTEPELEKTNCSTKLTPGVALLRAEAIHHSVLMLIIAVYCTIVTAYLISKDMLVLPLFNEYLFAMGFPIIAVAVLRIFGETVYHAVHVRPFLWAGLWRGIRQSELFSHERAAAAAIPIVLLPLFSGIITSFKIAIPQLVPFSWDPLFMHYDQIIHGGIHPWEILQPVLGHPLLTSAISYLYNLWHGMLLVVYWQIFRIKDRPLRMQFLLSFTLTWIVMGNVGAYLFSSAGPCYYGAVADGPNPYANLMTYLNEAHGQFRNWSVITQNYLWQIYQDDTAHLGGGISAMPSLHVSIALLLLLLARSLNARRFTWLAGIYLGVILVGSVHLGWHYALDGYVGLIGGWLAWIVAGWLVRTIVPDAPPSAPDYRIIPE